MPRPPLCTSHNTQRRREYAINSSLRSRVYLYHILKIHSPIAIHPPGRHFRLPDLSLFFRSASMSSVRSRGATLYLGSRSLIRYRNSNSFHTFPISSMAFCQFLLNRYPPATETIHPGNISPTPPRMSASLLRTSWQTSFARYVTSVLCFTVRKKMQNHRNNVEQMKSFQISRCLIRNVLCSYVRMMSYMITTVN